ncbi:PepSY-associated TM helix domain-containing protein [Roseomonas sp. CCTCC AB2023176]|uniref:PepSY-associated TM helix domain-containing protein n=1 Tax=Roseomonas sp. CCTCC AB2023176 TaxID=3342640 RepID=UPI0035DD4F6C
MHRWLGLLACAVLFLVALSGSAQVYWREIDAWLNPALYRASPGPDLGAAAAIRAAEAVSDDPIFLVRAPDATWPVWVVSHAVETPYGLDTWTTHVDPATGAVLGRRDYGRSLMHTILELHYTLLLRDWWGMELVGIVGLSMLASVGSGLWLWWPREGWRHAFRFALRPRGRMWWDLHRVTGAVAALVLAMVAYSGVALIFPKVAALPLAPVSETTPLRPPKVPDRDEPYAVDADTAMRAAEAALPGYRTWFLLPPEPPVHSWRISLKALDADTASGARNILWVDAWDGRVVGARTHATMGTADRWITAQISLHGGGYFGPVGRAVVCLSGLTLALLCVSGPVLYARRLRARRAAARRVGSFAQASS